MSNKLTKNDHKDEQVFGEDKSFLNKKEFEEQDLKYIEEQELRARKLKKKMLILGIVLLVLIAAYVALALYNKTLA